jgi:hypothetical protein
MYSSAYHSSDIMLEHKIRETAHPKNCHTETPIPRVSWHGTWGDKPKRWATLPNPYCCVTISYPTLGSAEKGGSSTRIGLQTTMFSESVLMGIAGLYAPVTAAAAPYAPGNWEYVPAFIAFFATLFVLTYPYWMVKWKMGTKQSALLAACVMSRCVLSCVFKGRRGGGGRCGYGSAGDIGCCLG